MIVLEWIFISALPALGLLVLFVLLNRWAGKNDPMGGRRGHIWKPDQTDRDDS